MHDEAEDSMAGQDSFIDVVCNMVGILIVLVMIVGIRSSRSQTQPVELATADTSALADEQALQRLSDAADELAEAQRDIESAVNDLADLTANAAITDARRQRLSLVKATVEQAIEERRAKLDKDSQGKFDVQRDLADAEIKLHQLQQQRISLLAQSDQVEEVECIPTPLARTVTGEEIHVRLKHKQLAVVPVDALLSEIERRGADHLRNNLRERGEAEDVFGPVDGFRMRLAVVRIASSTLPGAAPPVGPERPQVVLQGVFMPTSDHLGQPVEQSLLPTSPFMQAIRAKRANAPAVVVWVYPDSYAELRSIKRAMWDAGIPLAIRPLSTGQPIIFSSLGTKAAAQ
jgi:hypothetical protein